MGPLIQPATPDERETAAKQWRKDIRPRATQADDGVWYVSIGGVPLPRAMWILAHRLLVERLSTSDQLDVAAVDGEVVGWTCYGGGLVHHVWVHPAARETGLAAQLREHATQAAAETRKTA